MCAGFLDPVGIVGIELQNCSSCWMKPRAGHGLKVSQTFFLTNRNYSKSKSLSLVILIRLDHMNDLAINLFALQTPSRNTEAGDWQETYIDVDLVW
jgi:hypothetical protein